MALNLQVENEVSATSQAVEDQDGNTSSLTLSIEKVGIGTTNPQGKLDVDGNIVLNGNVKTQLSATGDSSVLKGSPIVFDLSPLGGGQLHIGNNTNDNKIFLEGFSSDGDGHASEMLITGRFAQSLPLFSVLADIMRLLGTVQIGENSNAAFIFSPSDDSPNAGYIRFGDNSGWKLHFGRSRENGTLTPNTGTTGVLLTIQDNGNVGIGTTEPQEKLEVNGHFVTNGDITVRGARDREVFQFDSQFAVLRVGAAGNEGDIIVRNNDGTEVIHLDGGSGDIILRNADCAEDFDLASAAAIEPGMVMVLGPDGALLPSTVAYDKAVAGVVSGAGTLKPGIVLDRHPFDTHRVPVALMGKVYCKVDATHSSVEVGDLLTTSSTLGHGMKATDPLRAFGAVIGKALQPLRRGTGLIPILVALQ